MPRSSSITLVTTTNRKRLSNHPRPISQATQSTTELGKSVVNQLKLMNSRVSIFRRLTKRKKFELDPVEEDRMQRYRKGFIQRSKDTDYDFDKIIHHGFGVWNNQCDYTLKLSLTPKQFRNPCY